MVYKIYLEGCDDSTLFEMDLNDEEYLLLKKFADKANETSRCCWMPRMYIEKNEE